MTHTERKGYVIYVSTAFITGFVLYGLLGLLLFLDNDISQQQTVLLRVLITVVIGILGGYLISSVLSGILLFINYMREKSMRFKVVAIVFFMITVQAIVLVGIVLNLPTYISNVLYLLRRRQIIEK